MKAWSDLQFEFDLDLDEVEHDAQERSISYQEARQISEASYQALRGIMENPERKCDWFEEFLSLIENGWPWRVACYIAWASSVKTDRWPRTLTDLAVKVLGLSTPRVIYTWRKKYKAIDSVVAMMQSSPLWAYRRAAFEALGTVASMPDYKGHQDRELLFKMTGDFIDKRELDIGKSSKEEIAAKSESELREWINDLVSADIDSDEDKDEHRDIDSVN